MRVDGEGNVALLVDAAADDDDNEMLGGYFLGRCVHEIFCVSPIIRYVLGGAAIGGGLLLGLHAVKVHNLLDKEESALAIVTVIALACLCMMCAVHNSNRRR